MKYRDSVTSNVHLSKEARRKTKRNIEIYEERLETNLYARIKKTIFDFFWDNDYNNYNTVGNTINEKYFPFWAL